MTRGELTFCVGRAREEAREALQMLFDNVNKGQQKQLVKNEEIRNMFDTFGVKYED